MSDSARSEGDVEASAASKAAAAHKVDTAAINDERRALDELGVAAKRAQQWTEWGGRTDPGAHMADLARTLEYKRLINIQDWLTFTSPQAAYAWRERERLQAVQMNYALWGGYTTPDQYLGYLQRQRTDLAGLNAVLLDRVSVYKENTDAALAYANALRGTTGSVGQLSEGLDLSGVGQFQSALVGLPDIVTTKLELDDGAALAALAQYESLLRAVPHSETTVLASSQERGAVPVTGQPAPDVIPVSFGGPYAEQFGAILAEVARLNALRAVIPVHFDLPPAAEITSFLSQIPAAGITEPVHFAPSGGAVGVGAGPPPEDITAWDALAAAQAKVIADAHMAGDAELKAAADSVAAARGVDALTAAYQLLTAARAAGREGEAEDLQDAITDLETLPKVAGAWTALSDAEAMSAIKAHLAAQGQLEAGAAAVKTVAEVDSLAAAWAKLSSAEVKASAAAGSFVPLPAGAGGAGGGAPPLVTPMPAGADEPPPDAAGKWAALGAAEKAAGDDADSAGIKWKAAAAALGTLSGSARGARGWFGLLAKDFTLFAGLFGSAAVIGTIAGWHIALDAIIEVLALLIPAVVTATAGLIGWGAAAAESGQKVYNQMKNVLTVSSALNTTVPPLTGNFQKLVDAVRPQVFQLFGDGLDLLNGKTGVFQDLIMKTGHALDFFGARIVVDLQQGGKGLQTFFDAGTKILGMFGQILLNLGHALSGFLRATEVTHIAEDLLAVVTVLSSLLDIIAKLPVPLLAAVIGFHGLAVWGGLAVTWMSKLAIALVSVFGAAGPLNGVMATLAGKLGASDAQLVKLAGHAPAVKQVAEALGQNAAGVAQFAVAADKSGKSVTELATSTEKGAAMFGKYATGLSQAGQDAVALAVAAGGTEAQIAKVAASSGKAAANTGFFASALAGVGGAAGLATIALGALAAAAVVFAVLSLRAKDSARQWIDSINKGLGSASLFTVIGKNVADLAAVTGRLSNAQGLNAQAVHELTGAQSELSGNLGLELSRVGQVSKAYGVGMVGALQLLNLAGVKTSDLFTRQGLVWQTDLQMVKGLVDGYKAMGQQIGTVGSDLNVLLVSESQQVKSMTTLNSAWDAWLATVTGGESSFIKVQQDFQAVDTAGQTAGASMLGLNKQSLTLRSAFISMVPDAGKVLDAIRLQTATMSSGAAGGALMTRATKDLAAQMIPLAGHSADARAAILALAQEANPSITTWQKLTQWVGHQGAAGAANDLQGVLFKLAVPVSDLQQDAAKLSNTLQGDLTPAMANAEFNALGGQKAFSTFAADLAKFGPGSQATVDAGKQVAQVLLSIDKNSATAKNQFVAWAQSMGLSQKQADQLWQKVSAGQKPLESMRQGLASSATASDNLAKSGFFAQRGDTFRTNMQQMGTWFSQTLPHAIGTAATAVAGAGKDIGSFFATAGREGASFFTVLGRDVASFAGSSWSKAWQNVAAPAIRAFTDIEHFVTSSFDAWWKSHGTEVEQVWKAVTSNLSLWWSNFTGGLERAWNTVVSWFKGNGDVSKPIKSGFDSLTTALKPVIDTIEGMFKLAWTVIEAGAKTAWDVIAAAGKTAWDALMAVLKTAWAAALAVLKIAWDLGVAALKVVWDAFVGVINVALDLITGHWSKAWHDMQATWNQINNAINTAFRQTWNAIWDFLKAGWNNFSGFFKQLWNNSIDLLKQLWNIWWGWFDRVIIGNFRTFFTRTIPGWFKDFTSFAKNSWIDSWHAFDNDIIGNLRHFFTSTVPAWWRDFAHFGGNAAAGVARVIEGAFKVALGKADAIINTPINFINNDILKHLPGGIHIPTLPTHFASGGAMRYSGPGSVPGTGDEDGTHIIAMGGEYMVRKPARMALEAAYGRGFMNTLNQADTWLAAGSRGSPATQQRRPGVNYAGGGVLASPFMADGGEVHLASGGAYQNPLRAISGLRPERIDMGVDYAGSGELYAVGPGRITNTRNAGWPGGAFISELLAGGQYAGLNVYMAENITPQVTTGMAVTSNTRIGHLNPAFPNMEIGWATPDGHGETAAAAAHQQSPAGDPGSRPTAYGVSMSNFLRSLGAPGGILSGKPVGSVNAVLNPVSVWQAIEGLLNSAGNALGSLVKPLARWVSGGEKELLKLAQEGSKEIFDFIWGHTVQPMVDVAPGDTIPGAVGRYGAAQIKSGIDNFLGGKDAAARAAAATANASTGSIGPVSGPADAGPGQAENYANSRLSAFGWGSTQMGPLSQLWMRESGWNRFARNPGSGAYGIPQSLPPTKLPFAGQAGGGSHASPQIDWGLGYIKSNPSYGSPAAAWAHELAHGWYPHGGVVGGDGADLMSVLGMASGGTAPPPPLPVPEAFRASGGLADDFGADDGPDADGGLSFMAEGGAVTSLRRKLAAEQAGEKAKYFGLEHSFAIGPAKYRTALTRQELGTLAKHQGYEQAAYAALSGAGLTTTRMHHLGAEARAEESTAADKELNRVPGGHPGFAADLRKYLGQISTTASGTVPAGATGAGTPATAASLAALRKKLAAAQAGERAKYLGLEHSFAIGPAKYRTKLTEQELHTLASRQAAEQAAYAALSGAGLTTVHLRHLGATARAELSTASDKELSRAASAGGHPGFAYDLRKYLAELSTLSGSPVSAGTPPPAPGPVPPPVSAVPGLVPEWTDAGSLAGAMGALNTAVVSVESPAFWKLMGEKLPAKATRAQHAALTAWDRVLTAQQYKTIGLGHSPPGAYDAIHKNLFSPAKITAGQWSIFSSDVNRLVAEEAGTGIKGGINPPGTPANSGHVPWQYFRAQWKALRSGLLKVQQRIPLAQQVWANVYGPHHLPFTPGPAKPPLVPPLGGTVNVMPEATMGGPSVPVLPGSGTPDMGFAAGGSLGDVASMFGAGMMPQMPAFASGGPVLPVETVSRLAGGTSGQEYPRSLSDAGAVTRGDRVGVKVENMIVNNPSQAETVGQSIAHASNRLSFLAGRGLN